MRYNLSYVPWNLVVIDAEQGLSPWPQGVDPALSLKQLGVPVLLLSQISPNTRHSVRQGLVQHTDVITTTSCPDDRHEATTLISNVKNKNNQLFTCFRASVNLGASRISDRGEVRQETPPRPVYPTAWERLVLED